MIYIGHVHTCSLSCVFGFPVLEEDILSMVQPNPPAIHFKYISNHTAGICLLSRQVTNADLKVQYSRQTYFIYSAVK